VDANGILNVSAKDKATGKEQAITITANSGLSDDEINGMVADAEQHADDDKKFAELADLRNQADGMAHSTEKAIADLGDKVTDEEKGPITEAIDQLKEATKGDDKADIEAKLAKLTELSGPVMQKVYADQAAEAQAAEGGAEAAPEDDSVVDAEFTEVEDEEKKA
jgi:molecular chaperone DnaK